MLTLMIQRFNAAAVNGMNVANCKNKKKKIHIFSGLGRRGPLNMAVGSDLRIKASRR